MDDGDDTDGTGMGAGCQDGDHARRRRCGLVVLVVALVAGLLVPSAWAGVGATVQEGMAAVDGASSVGGCPTGLVALVTPDGARWCSHGDDHQLARSQEQALVEVNRADGPVPSVPVACYGDGVSGPRVQVLYLHPDDQPDRSTELAGDLQRWVGQVAWTISASAAATGGTRHVRWVTEQAEDGACEAAVVPVALPVDAFASFTDTIAALRAAGYDRTDRKYLAFADVDSGCGISTLPTDDRPGAENEANQLTGYARIDRGCWTTGDDGFYAVPAHELMHTLGAVQRSSPNATAHGHCDDEWDVMCYQDGPDTVIRTVCRDQNSQTLGAGDHHNRLLDCGGDDYFRVPARPGSYLADHWNTADSVYLATTASDGPGFAPRRPTVAPDARGREISWPAGDLGGPHRPLLPDAFGWEACSLPVTLAVAPAGTQAGADGSGSGLLGGLLGGDSGGSSGSTDSATPGPDPDLLAAARQAAAEVNGAVGTSVLAVTDQPAADGPAPDGTIVLRWGSAAPTRLAVRTADARIVAATIVLDATTFSRAGDAADDTYALQAVAQALGIGRVGGTTDLMAPYPPPGARRDVVAGALRHLYGEGCDVDPRLDDTAPGAATQRTATGTRHRVDLARDATDVIGAAVDVAGWLNTHRQQGWATRAVVCRDDVYADCLAGAGLVGRDGPIVYVPGGPDGRLPAAVGDVLDTALAAGARVDVLGGTQAVSAGIEDALRTRLLGRRVQRIAGADRFATAAAVAEQVVTDGGDGNRVALARADDPADAVAVGAAAATKHRPVLLTLPDALPAATRDALGHLGHTLTTVVGGTAAVSPTVAAEVATHATVVRAAGRTRSETAVAVARAPALFNRSEVVDRGSAIGVDGWSPATWALALAAAPVGAYLHAPVLFTGGDAVPSAAPSASGAGDTLQQLENLDVRGTDVSVVSVFVGAGTWASPSVAEAFHGALLPGIDGNVTVTRG